MDEKVNQQLQKLRNEIKAQRKEYVEVFNTTHRKIEISEKQLCDMIAEQREIIEALITILVKNDLIKDSTEVGDIIDAKKVMEKITYVEPTEQEIQTLLQVEMNALRKLLYRSKGDKI